MKKKPNKFQQLVDDLNSGELGYIHIQNAMRVNVRQSKYIPEGIKDLLGGKEHNPGLICKQFSLLKEITGSLELAYRRGKTDGE